MSHITRIKDLIADRDIKQKVLAREFNIPESTLSNYLTQRTEMPIEILVKIAGYLSVTTDYLLGLTDDPAPAYPVSAGEREMLERFRSLSREQKELIVQNIELMRKQNQR